MLGQCSSKAPAACEYQAVRSGESGKEECQSLEAGTPRRRCQAEHNEVGEVQRRYKVKGTADGHNAAAATRTAT